MKRLLILLLLLLGSAGLASARDSVKGWCEEGNRPVVTSGLNSTTRVQASHPSCTVTVYVHGGGLATIYADNNNTPLANPFTAQSGGRWQAYADDGRYDVTMSSAGFSQTVTYSDIILCDPFVPGGVCAAGTGGGGGPHNLLSTTHLDTIPFSPPVRGDLITAQNLTSPTGVTPAWARLPLGTAGQVVISDGTDALWGNITAGTNITINQSGSTLTINSTGGGGSGCTLPAGGVSNGVLEENPKGTCDDTASFTWSLANKSLQAGDTNTINSADGNVFVLGSFNTLGANQSFSYVVGENNTLSATVSGSENWIFGRDNSRTGANGQNDWMIGRQNSITDVSGHIFLIGRSNTAASSTGGTGASVRDCVAIGESNHLTLAPTLQPLFNCSIIGFSNTIVASGASFGVSNAFIAGESNTINSTTGNLVDSIHIVGASNNVFNTLGQTAEVEIVGEQNEVNGAQSTVQVLGFLNVVHNGSQQATGVNTTVVGSGNTVTTVGAAGTPAYQGIFGGLDTLTNCSSCWIVGENVSNSTSSTLAVGMAASATPAFIITKNGTGDYLTHTPHAFNYYPACAAGTEGTVAAITNSNSATNGTIITGGGTNHVLGYCDGTNWKVIVGT